MQIVIKISDTLKKILDSHDIITASHPMWVAIMMDAIANGTPLPKGHGRLIDADKIATHLEEMRDVWKYYGDEYEEGRCQSYYNALDEVANAQTIIEAESEEV